METYNKNAGGMSEIFYSNGISKELCQITRLKCNKITYIPAGALHKC